MILRGIDMEIMYYIYDRKTYEIIESSNDKEYIGKLYRDKYTPNLDEVFANASVWANRPYGMVELNIKLLLLDYPTLDVSDYIRYRDSNFNGFYYEWLKYYSELI